VIDPFRKYIEGWVDDSHGRVRADVVQDKLEALGHAAAYAWHVPRCGSRSRTSVGGCHVRLG
jgi:hypothetical protein